MCVLVFIHCMHIVCECICYVGMCFFHRTCNSSFQVKALHSLPLTTWCPPVVMAVSKLEENGDVRDLVRNRPIDVLLLF